jgi:pyrimidine operon attenuation protein/uracil phosphoribosyltransferase
MAVRPALSASDIERALRRISHEIVEGTPETSVLVVLGIPTRGAFLAHRLAAMVSDITGENVAVGSLDVTLYRDDLSGAGHRSPAPTDLPAGGIDGAVVVLVDDVLFSGRTIRAALDALTALGRPRAVKLAVLVDRGHRELPIRADHVGKNLPSAPGERVSVHLEEVDGVDEVVVEL